MIPVSRQYEAIYKCTDNLGKAYYSRLPVEAWSDDGAALVVDLAAGRLREARSYADFERLQETDGHTVGAIPGGGWLLSAKDGEAERTEPVVGWSVTAGGVWAAHTADGEGYVETVDIREGDGQRLVPPDGAA